jgi:hypothetical protein
VIQYFNRFYFSQVLKYRKQPHQKPQTKVRLRIFTTSIVPFALSGKCGGLILDIDTGGMIRLNPWHGKETVIIGGYPQVESNQPT